MFVNIIITFITLSLAATLGYWTQDRRPPTRIMEVRALTEVVRPGGNVLIYYEVERERGCHVHVEQIIFDSQRRRIAAPDEDYTGAPGPARQDTFALSVSIPTNVSEGTARYRAIRSYYCNPIHRWFDWPIVVVTPDITFTIGTDAG